MKVAIFHNFLDNIGGAEKVTLCLARNLGADIYTTVFNAEKIKKMGFSDVLPRIKSIGWVPKNPPYRQQLTFLRFRFFKLKEGYDQIIIAGDWAMSGAVRNKPNLWYVHSPMREIWDLYEYTRKYTVPWYLRGLFDIWVWQLRFFNKRHIKHVNKIMCNSKNTQQRVAKYLHRSAEVIHPPLILPKKKKTIQNKGYWLSVNRLISHKRIELQLEAFSKLPNLTLIIVGSYEKGAVHFEKYRRKIETLKPENVQIKNWVSQEELESLYANCTGFITTAHNEDFGMTPVEAMSYGKPVIAVNEGGYKETVIHNKTGKLIKPTVSDLVKAITSIEKDSTSFRKDCISQSKQFSEKRFIKNIWRILS